MSGVWPVWAPSIRIMLYYKGKLPSHLFPCYLHKIVKTATLQMNTEYRMFVPLPHREHHNKAVAKTRSWLCTHVIWTDKRQRASFEKGSEGKGHCKSRRQWRMVRGKKPKWSHAYDSPSVLSPDKLLLSGDDGNEPENSLLNDITIWSIPKVQFLS